MKESERFDDIMSQFLFQKLTDRDNVLRFFQEPPGAFLRSECQRRVNDYLQALVTRKMDASKLSELEADAKAAADIVSVLDSIVKEGDFYVQQSGIDPTEMN